MATNRSNQAMQLTAPVLFPPLRVATTFNSQPRALPGAVADLVLVRRMLAFSPIEKISLTATAHVHIVDVWAN
jgi:hypothetical protein